MQEILLIGGRHREVISINILWNEYFAIECRINVFAHTLIAAAPIIALVNSDLGIVDSVTEDGFSVDIFPICEGAPIRV